MTLIPSKLKFDLRLKKKIIGVFNPNLHVLDFLNLSFCISKNNFKNGAGPQAGKNFDIWLDFGWLGHDLAAGFGSAGEKFGSLADFGWQGSDFTIGFP